MAPPQHGPVLRQPARPQQQPNHPKRDAETQTPDELEDCDYFYSVDDDDDELASASSSSINNSQKDSSGSTSSRGERGEKLYISSYQRSRSWASDLSTTTLDDHEATAVMMGRRSSSASVTSAKLLKLMKPFTRNLLHDRAASV
ncbi:hypothetical protein Slin15195_G065870 [Septoria linicola]|uniref:Uncharacterized protein n=1 Tax=Septoria linicola TaxID=215465 RepID=A0A9Q9ELB3_9PEZI|nr:hypothetical protein Slin14017_G116210 [Septoria linicola]USW53268.1 hypothetical protein Slin15195_G065870 [Septoria linicola]